MKRNFVILAIIAAVVTGMLIFATRVTRGASNASTGVGGGAPDFALNTTSGKTLHLSDFRGKAVVLNFWATWCGPCKIEMPWFVDLQKKYEAQGLQVVGVAMDDSSKEDIDKFTQEMSVNYPIVIGKEATADSYGGLPALPTTLYIDREGKVVDRVIGLRGRAEIEQAMQKIIASKPPAQ